MTSLIPELQLHLMREADRLAPGPERAARFGLNGRRLRQRTFAAGIAGALAVSAGAYAARALWNPPVGNDDGGRPTVARAPAPAEQLSALGVLRRPQTPADRGAASLRALRGQSTTMVDRIRVDGVRRLGTTPAGDPIVLVPGQRVPQLGVAGAAAVATGRPSGDVLCLSVADTASSFGQTCQDTTGLLNGDLFIASIKELPRTGARERAWRAWSEAPATEYARRHGGALEPANLAPPIAPTAPVVAVVPDGVARVRLEAGNDRRTIAVHDNLFQATVSTDRFLGAHRTGSVVWLAADGTALSRHHF